MGRRKETDGQVLIRPCHGEEAGERAPLSSTGSGDGALSLDIVIEH